VVQGESRKACWGNSRSANPVLSTLINGDRGRIVVKKDWYATDVIVGLHKRAVGIPSRAFFSI